MKKIAIIGAGPAGISAAYELSKADFNITLHEKSNQIGGLARTMEFSDAKFDVGPHRFFTYNKEVENLYLKILDKDAIEVKRLTRILYNNKLFKYPLSPFGTIIKIGFIGAIKILASPLVIPNALDCLTNDIHSSSDSRSKMRDCFLFIVSSITPSYPISRRRSR